MLWCVVTELRSVFFPSAGYSSGTWAEVGRDQWWAGLSSKPTHRCKHVTILECRSRRTVQRFGLFDRGSERLVSVIEKISEGKLRIQASASARKLRNMSRFAKLASGLRDLGNDINVNIQNISASLKLSKVKYELKMSHLFNRLFVLRYSLVCCVVALAARSLVRLSAARARCRRGYCGISSCCCQYEAIFSCRATCCQHCGLIALDGTCLFRTSARVYGTNDLYIADKSNLTTREIASLEICPRLQSFPVVATGARKCEYRRAEPLQRSLVFAASKSWIAVLCSRFSDRERWVSIAVGPVTTFWHPTWKSGQIGSQSLCCQY